MNIFNLILAPPGLAFYFRSRNRQRFFERSISSTKTQLSWFFLTTKSTSWNIKSNL